MDFCIVIRIDVEGGSPIGGKAYGVTLMRVVGGIFPKGDAF